MPDRYVGQLPSPVGYSMPYPEATKRARPATTRRHIDNYAYQHMARSDPQISSGTLKDRRKWP